jgi:tetratricopeptide (TPR) repeat protein
LDESSTLDDAYRAAVQSGDLAAAASRAKDIAARSSLTDRDRLDLAIRLTACGESVEAADLARRIASSSSTGVRLLSDAGVLLSRLNLHNESETAFKRALDRSPDDPDILFNLAMVQRFLGRLEDSETNCDKVIRMNPEHGEAFLIRSQLRRQSPERNHVESLRKRLSRGFVSWRTAAQIQYALAKELEDLGRYEESFRALRQGAEIRRRRLQYDVNRDVEVFRALRETFTAQWISAQSGRGHSDDSSIFIVGLPRTGTTLTERILGGSPDVASGGELLAFPNVLMRLVRGAGIRPASPADLVRQSVGIDFSALGRLYSAEARQGNKARRYLTDKLPFNYLYLGLIHLALPRAKIVLLLRDPVDTCYAIYKTYFEAAYPFSYDMEEVATYYSAFARLMDHWRDVLPNAVHTVHYEKLVTEPRATAASIFSFCDLKWSPEHLRTEAVDVPSTTASAAQVRSPIYTSSIGLWRNYERELAPMIKRLRDNGVLHGVSHSLAHEQPVAPPFDRDDN